MKENSAIITGAGSGIGQAIAVSLAEEGNHVVILELDQESGNQTADLIKAAGGSAEVLECDVSNFESVQSAFDAIERVDILVNNAGIASVGNVGNTSPEEFEKVYQVNVKGVYHCLQFGVKKMVSQGGGVVLNMASIASKVGISDRFAYSMSKGAVLTMTLSVARDYVNRGIRANCICPARVHTPFVDGYLEKNFEADEREKMFKNLSEYQPIGRMGEAQEIAALAAFLCSDKAAFITGSAYDIDGGVTRLR
jgi:NAD(P)-dependent dehydrogenase (short-subunit alcohol dehydrogenase family)